MNIIWNKEFCLVFPKRCPVFVAHNFILSYSLRSEHIFSMGMSTAGTPYPWFSVFVKLDQIDPKVASREPHVHHTLTHSAVK